MPTHDPNAEQNAEINRLVALLHAALEKEKLSAPQDKVASCVMCASVLICVDLGLDRHIAEKMANEAYNALIDTMADCVGRPELKRK